MLICVWFLFPIDINGKKGRSSLKLVSDCVYYIPLLKSLKSYVIYVITKIRLEEVCTIEVYIYICSGDEWT